METTGHLYAFSGGGTGGHLMPGLALASALRRENPDNRIQFVGSSKPLEQELVARHGYPHLALHVEPLHVLKRAPWRFALRNWQAYRQASRWLKLNQPRCVIGLGGYASAPLVYAAARLGIPTLILEQNVIPGRATRWLASRVDAVVVAFAATREWLVGTLYDLGTPVRAEIAALSGAPPENPESPMLLILGGSQGATDLNEAVLRMVEKSSDILTGWKILHQTGAEQVESVQDRYTRQDLNGEATSFIVDMAACFRQTTLVISRAGATTLAELTCAGRPAILVPYPYAADDHQRKNADHFVREGAATLVTQQPDPEVTATLLREAVSRIISDPLAGESMKRRMHAVARPHATEEIVALIRKISG